MPRKKRAIKQENDYLKKAEKLIKKKPREFVIGFVVLIILLLGSAAFSGYLYIRSVNFTKQQKMIKKQATKQQKTPQYHILQENESLWDVAEKEYGSPYLYPTLVELNNLESPDIVEPGMRIKIR